MTYIYLDFFVNNWERKSHRFCIGIIKDGDLKQNELSK